MGDLNWTNQDTGAGGTLQHRAVRGVVWIFLSKVVSEGVRLLKIVILARLLTPEDFGLMALALLVLGSLETVTATGFNSALIRHREDVRPYLDTYFGIQALRGVALAGALYLAAPYTGAFFQLPEVVSVVQVLGSLVLVRGLVNPAIVHVVRELDFRKLFFWNMSEVVTALAVALPAALVYRSVWALVIAVIAGEAVKTMVSYLVVPYCPMPKVDWQKVKELGGFGKWVSGSNFVVFLSLQADHAFIGKLLGAGFLGLYQMAFRIAELPVVLVTQVLTQVAFPAFSLLQENRLTLAAAYFRALRILLVLNGMFVLAVYSLADELVPLTLGMKWVPMIPALKILSLASVIRSTAALGGWLFYAIGKPQLNFMMNAVRLLAMTVTIYPLASVLGVTGVAYSVLIAVCAAIPVYTQGISTALGISRLEHVTRLFSSGTRGDLSQEPSGSKE